jgi:adenylate cyclase
MPSPPVSHRLSAILVADVVGFSRLMGQDETGTLTRLRERRAELLEPLIARHGGRAVKFMGDGVLAEFPSAVEAVKFALALQAAFAVANEGETVNEPIVLRIGINLGEVVVEGRDIFGDGVNIAARLESRAPVGGIAISDSVHVQVRGKVLAGFESLGALELKNIAQPVAAWAWPAAMSAAASETQPPAGPAEPGRHGPAVAVLPFTNMSGDAEQDYFSDGISEDIITDLSKVAGLAVTARNSSFVYKGQNVDIRRVGRELGVTSVLEGSVRRAGSRIRITAQLIDAATGNHLWAERYDRDLTDIFAVQDEVTLEIVKALKVTLKPREEAMLAAKPPVNFAAHENFLRGRDMVHQLWHAAPDSPAIVVRALETFSRAIEIDPNFGAAYAHKAICLSLEYVNHYTGMDAPLDQSEATAREGLARDPEEPYLHYVMAVIRLFRHDLEGARAHARRTLELSPGFAAGHAIHGNLEICGGNPHKGIELFERALRLDPSYSSNGYHFIGLAHLLAGEDEEAAAMFRKRISIAPRTDLSRVGLACALGHLGRIDEAREAWHEALALNPAYSLEENLKRMPFRPEQVARIREGLAKAGLPD